MHKTVVNTFGKTALFFALAVFALSGCSSPDMEQEQVTGTLTINLGSNGRAAWPPQDHGILGDLDHTITLTGPGPKQTINVKGGGTVSATVETGTWTVNVEAYYAGELYASGDNTVDVIAGQSNPCPISMKENPDLTFFVVKETDDWDDAVLQIEAAGSYVINITAGFSLIGYSANTFSGSGINVTINGNGKTIDLLGSNCSLLYIREYQTVTIKDLNLTRDA